MNRFSRIAFFSMALCLSFTPFAFAASAVEKGERAAEKQENPPVIASPDIDKYQDKTQEIYDLLEEISKGLSSSEEKHFGMIYNNYNLIGTVKMVADDVDNAVDACSEANPDMENSIRGRYKEWRGAVDPVIEEAAAHLDNMVNAQEYAKPKEISKLFKAVDDTRKFTNKQVKKEPVTSPDACEYLRDKMDDTQNNLTRLLRETLMSVPPEPESVKEEPAEKAPEERSEKQAPAEDKPAQDE